MELSKVVRSQLETDETGRALAELVRGGPRVAVGGKSKPNSRARDTSKPNSRARDTSKPQSAADVFLMSGAGVWSDVMATLAEKKRNAGVHALAAALRAQGMSIDEIQAEMDERVWPLIDKKRPHLFSKREFDEAIRSAKRYPAGPSKRAEPDAEEEDEFWSARPVLTHVLDFARGRIVSPWAMLGAVLVRVVCEVSPHVVLPPIIGSAASLNLIVALVGESGGGKDTAARASADAFEFSLTHTIKPGSGEGLVRAFAHRERGKKGEAGEVVIDRRAVLVKAMEIDTLTAVGARQGATLMSELRETYLGGPLGHGYADAAKNIQLEPHSYRLGMLLGVQPSHADKLFEGADAGTPQRILWLSAIDPALPEQFADLEAPPPRRLQVPLWARVRGDEFMDLRPETELHEIDVPDSIRSALREAQYERLRSGRTSADDPLDGHNGLARLKVAAALGLLEDRGERVEVTEEDWQLAGVVLDASDATRAGISEVLAAKSKAANTQRAKQEAARQIVVSSTVEKHGLASTRQSVLNLLDAERWTSYGELNRDIGSRRREFLNEALDSLLMEELIEDAEFRNRGQLSVKYRLA